MSLIHAIIIGNITVIMFNLLGMVSGFNPPPLWAYAIGWPGTVAIVYFVGQIP